MKQGYPGTLLARQARQALLVFLERRGLRVLKVLRALAGPRVLLESRVLRGPRDLKVLPGLSVPPEPLALRDLLALGYQPARRRATVRWCGVGAGYAGQRYPVMWTTTTEPSLTI